MFRRLGRLYDGLIESTGVVPGLLIGLIAFGVGADVLLRNVGFGGIEWMLETVEYGLLLLTMVGAAYVLRTNRHVTVDVVVGILPERLRKFVAIVANAIASLICLVFIWCGILAAADAYQSGAKIYKAFTIEEWVPISLIPPAFVLVTIECVRRLMRSIGREGTAGASQDLGF